MSNTPTPPPPTAPATAPAVRFRVVSGSDLVKRSKSPQVTQNFQSQPPPQRIRYARPGERFVYARPPQNYHIQRNELQFSQQNQPIQVRRAIPTIIRQPITRIIRPINPQQNGNADNKKKLVTILRSFLTRCATTPTESNMSQMIITTEQYLKGVVSTSDYMQILHQNVKGVRDTLASFLELNIYAVRKDIQEKKIAMEEVVLYQVVKTESYQYITPSSSSQPQQQQIIYSTPSPSIETAASTEQLRYVKSEPMSVSSSNSQQEQVSTPSPMIPVSSSSMSYQIAKMEAGSSRSSPILRTSSPHFQMLNKSHGSVGANEQQHHQRASPLTITRDLSMQQQQPKTSPLAATTAPNMEMQTSSFYEQQPQEPMETSQLLPPSQETFITPADSQPLQFEPQPSQQPQISPPPAPQDAIDNGTPLTELPHDIALQRSLIDPATFSALMQRKVPGITIESPAFLMISEFLETKIRKLISDARLAAEHRSQQFRSNPNYVEAENPRAQLNAIEKAEKAEKQRKIDRENERLLKNSKNDPNKVKELTKTKEDESLNRDANEAAMSALGGKKRTWQSRKPDGSDGGPAAKKAALARAKQISMKDLLFAFEKDSFAKDSIVYRKVLYGLYNENKN